MGPRTFASEIDRRLRSAGSRRGETSTLGYVSTSMEVLGVSTPDLRVIVREVGRALRSAPAREVLALVRSLMGAGTFEGRQAAYEILSGHRAARESLRTRSVEALGKGIDNWASVDAFACCISGPSWREDRVTDAAVHRWARSGDRWWRRTAIVSTVPLNLRSRGGTGDAPRTLRICEIVAGDGDDMVVKGLSWALRELAKRDRAAVTRFLRRRESSLHARVLREVRNKLRHGLKNPRGGGRSRSEGG